MSKAERLGNWAGKGWRGYVRRERRVTGWLIAHGVPGGAAKVLLWAVKLVLLGVLLYLAFWLALALLFVIAAAWTARNTDWDEKQEPEWKNGPAGFGLYTYDGYRIDPHVSDED